MRARWRGGSGGVLVTQSIGPDVGVVFVSYYSAELVIPRAEKLVESGAAVVIADNAGDLAGLDLQVIDTGANVGFGAACNAAVAALDPSVAIVCFHNPDVDASPAAVEALAARVRGGGGLVAPAVHRAGRVRTHGYHYPSPAREAMLAARATRTSVEHLSRERDGARRRHRGVGRRFGSAALLGVDRAHFDAVGGFDARYFLYAEDLDLWHRMKRSGRRAVFAPDVVVDHAGAAGASLGRPTRELLRWLGVEFFAERFALASWRPFRAAHRPFLRHLDAEPALVDAVADAWGAGLPPSEVLAAVRPSLERPVTTGAQST
jgi:N-acetylglucosaminyl-diphospho-decaprenol L-rhamnosyltransferase